MRDEDGYCEMCPKFGGPCPFCGGGPPLGPAVADRREKAVSILMTLATGLVIVCIAVGVGHALATLMGLLK
jgi:hypothetical protein